MADAKAITVTDPRAVPAQSRALTLLKTTGVAASSLLLALLLARSLAGLAAAPGWWLAGPAFVLGYLLADLASGTTHWFCDTFFDEDTPLIGRLVIFPFRDHHACPQRITRYRFIQQDTSNFFLMLPLLAVSLARGAPTGLVAWAWDWAVIGLAVGSFGTNLFHKWAHAPVPPRLVRWAQRRHLILRPERHARHHADHLRAFCVTSGWLNPLLDAVRFFPRLERAVRTLAP